MVGGRDERLVQLLHPLYRVIFIGAITVKVRDGQVRNADLRRNRGQRDRRTRHFGACGPVTAARAPGLAAGADRAEEPRRHRCVHRGLRRTQRAAECDHDGVGADRVQQCIIHLRRTTFGSRPANTSRPAHDRRQGDSDKSNARPADSDVADPDCQRHRCVAMLDLGGREMSVPTCWWRREPLDLHPNDHVSNSPSSTAAAPVAESLAPEVCVLGLGCSAVTKLITCLSRWKARVVHQRCDGLTIGVRLDLLAESTVNGLDRVRRISHQAAARRREYQSGFGSWSQSKDVDAPGRELERAPARRRLR